jgi:UDP-N-acetylglucosamine/UDP-N-acetylgalactosamine diphosphorylase
MNQQEATLKLQAYGQEHVLRFYDTLPPQQQAALLQQIQRLDLSVLDQLKTASETERGTFSPLGALTRSEIAEKSSHYRQLGLDAIRSGKVGCVLLAGGQGSRLGFEHPKGMYRIGVNRDLYIFECLFRNLMEVTQEAGAEIHLMLMTNAANDAETKAFLKAHDYFGYNPDYVHFFVQEMAPVIDAQQQILLTSPDKIAMSPNGNGGWFSSMYHAGLLPMIESAGIQWLNVFAVDNVLQRMADPVFIGATIDSGCACGGKVVAKAAPEERVGVLCLEDGKPSIVEYFEMTDAMRTQREPDGRLSYNYGVILNYLFRTDALMKTLSQKLPLHMAHKAVAYVDASGTPIKPDKPNAYKFETLVLDMIHMQDSCMAFEVDREREFAPVKNREGVDSVDTARELLRKNGVQL